MPELCEDMRRPQKGQNPLEWAHDYSSRNPDFYRIHAVAPLPTLNKKEIPVPRPYAYYGGGDEYFESSPNAVEVSVSHDGESSNTDDNLNDNDVVNVITESFPLPVAVEQQQQQHHQQQQREKVTVEGQNNVPIMSPIAKSTCLEAEDPHMDDATVESWLGDDFSLVPHDDELFERDTFANIIFPSTHKPSRGGPRSSSTKSTTTTSATLVGHSKLCSTPVLGQPRPYRLITPSLHITPSRAVSADETSSSSATPAKKPRLSQADLNYLAFQNKMLLEQEHVHREDDKGAEQQHYVQEGQEEYDGLHDEMILGPSTEKIF